MDTKQPYMDVVKVLAIYSLLDSYLSVHGRKQVISNLIPR